MFLSTALTIALAGAVLVLWWRQTKSSSSAHRRLPLPPGPKPLPLIGNALDFPKLDECPWRVYAQWAQQYGDIIHIRVLGQSVIILNSLRAVHDLFAKRSATYQDREITEMIKLTGWDWNFAMMKYGERWRQHRRLFHQFLNGAVVHTYEPHLREGGRDLLKRLHREPNEFVGHTRYTIGKVMLSMTYGIQVANEGDRYVAMLEQALESVEQAVLPGSFLVDFLPFLKYVPSWLPGTGWQRKVAEWKVETFAVREVPWRERKEASRSAIAVKLADRISRLEGDAGTGMQEIAQNICAAVYAGAADTTLTTLRVFFLAMAMYPDAQKRAQAELAKVVGPTRLPDFQDWSSLPYVRAVYKECLRWQPVAPMGFPHRCVADDEYRGYLIPEGSIVIQNTWGILHDPEVYPEPENFIPERYLEDGEWNPNAQDPASVVFGAGRRICPGRYFADQSIFIYIAYILHVFEITPTLGVDGKPTKIEPEVTSGFLSHPNPFECTIKARATWAEALIAGDNASNI